MYIYDNFLGTHMGHCGGGLVLYVGEPLECIKMFLKCGKIFRGDVSNSIRVFIAYSYIPITIWRQMRRQIKKIYLEVFFRNVILYHVLKFWADRMTLSKVMGAEAQILVKI